MEAQLAATRTFNFRLLRNRRGGHAELVRQLHGLVNWKDVSDFALGRRAIDESKARGIEHHLDLALGWLDRDYEAMFGATKAKFEVVDLVSRAAPDVREAIRTILQCTGSHGVEPRPEGKAPLTLVK